MLIIKDLSSIPSPLPEPIGITLGSFDCVHLGHKFLITRLRELVSPSGTVAVITFQNHPAQVLKNRPFTSPLYTLEQRCYFLEKEGVDLLLLLTFNEEFASQPYDQFLETLKEKLPFSHLVLGQGASFGRGKGGDEPHVKQLEKKLRFRAEYLPKRQVEGLEVSCGKVREAVEKGDLATAEKLLGRPFKREKL